MRSEECWTKLETRMRLCGQKKSFVLKSEVSDTSLLDAPEIIKPFPLLSSSLTLGSSTNVVS